MPREQPWLSVCMPVHNGGLWLKQTLDSVSAQDCSGIEFLIFDSSQDDACEQIVQSFGERLQVRYERMCDLRSWPAKTNLAVERASAPHVAMLHQDDIWLPNRTAEVQKSLFAFPDATMILSPSHIIDERGRRMGSWRCPLPQNRPLLTTEIAEPLLVQNFVAVPAPVIRRSAWLDCGGMESTLWYTADWDLYLKLIRQGPAVYNPRASTGFRVHGDSLTVAGSRDRAGFEAQMRTVLHRHMDLVPSGRRPLTGKRADASIAVNCALARAAAGEASDLFNAAQAILALGPFQALRYVSESRILDRALPRVLARLAGSF